MHLDAYMACDGSAFRRLVTRDGCLVLVLVTDPGVDLLDACHEGARDLLEV
jgi:hypothetical protein